MNDQETYSRMGVSSINSTIKQFMKEVYGAKKMHFSKNIELYEMFVYTIKRMCEQTIHLSLKV
jgi:hypothetical protein